MTEPVLEAAAQGITDATANPPFLYELGPAGARKVLHDLQAARGERVPPRRRRRHLRRAALP